MYVCPKKQLGQHFLTDVGIARAIADALRAEQTPVTLEIGPGTGVLSRHLLSRPELQLYAVEVDSESIDFLREEFPQWGERLLAADFLKMDLNRLFPAAFNVIGNFPYNISSQIFFRVLEYRDRIPEVVCMLQKEVAVRLAEPPGSKDYGILSVMLQAYYHIEYLFTVNENVFNPPPKVKSGVIRLVRNEVTTLDCDETLFFRIVKATFNQRRKTIRNSLRAAFPDIVGEHPFFTRRPETLGVAEFSQLTRWVSENRIPPVDHV